MATLNVCDGGCGATSRDTSLHRRGVTLPKHYCDVCVESIDKYMAERNEAHVRICRDWQQSLEKLNAAWKLNHPKGSLPDE